MSPTGGPGDETALGETLVRILRAVVDDVDVIGLLDTLTAECAALFAVRAAGVLLGDRSGTLHVVASSDERPELVELLELQSDQGPCRDCVRSGVPVVAADLDDPAVGRRWPRFTARALAGGVRAAHAVPMRLPSRTVGALNLLGASPGDLPAEGLRAAQAVADAATVGILADPGGRSGATVVEQMRTAIAGRVVIEQAKGVLAERGGLEVADAFVLLRDHAHRTGRRLTDIAHGILDGTLDTAVVLRVAPPGS